MTQYTFSDRVVVGDECMTIEQGGGMYFEWKSVVTEITDSYIETVYVRERLEMFKPYSKAYVPNTVKNYFHPITREINIKPLYP
jgi:hypothetical protein